MPFYLFQARYTPEAIKAMVENPHDRGPAGKALVESVGGKLHHIFFAMGTEDIVALVEAPNDEAMAAGAMVLAASGAFAGGATTKLMTTAAAVDAMKTAKASRGKYKPPTG